MPLPTYVRVLLRAAPPTTIKARAVNYHFLDRCPAINPPRAIDYHFLDRCPAIDPPKVINYHFLDRCPAIDPRHINLSGIAVFLTSTVAIIIVIAAVVFGTRYLLSSSPSEEITYETYEEIISEAHKESPNEQSFNYEIISEEFAYEEFSFKAIPREEPTYEEPADWRDDPVAIANAEEMVHHIVETTGCNADLGSSSSSTKVAKPKSSATQSRSVIKPKAKGKKATSQQSSRRQGAITDLVDDLRAALGDEGLAAVAATLPPPATISRDVVIRDASIAPPVQPPAPVARSFEEFKLHEATHAFNFDEYAAAYGLASAYAEVLRQEQDAYNRRLDQERGIETIDLEPSFATIVEADD